MESTSNIKVREGQRLGLILAVLVLLPALLLWLAGSPMAYAQAKSNPTSYTITDLGTLGGVQPGTICQRKRRRVGKVHATRRYRVSEADFAKEEFELAGSRICISSLRSGSDNEDGKDWRYLWSGALHKSSD